MGIKKFQTWLKTNYPNCLINCDDRNIYDYIYVDTNYLLYNSMNNCRSESEFMNKMNNYLNLILYNFIATKKIILAIDGPSSFAKIFVQRKRRFDASKKNKSDHNKINSLYLTPGTQFMNRVYKHLRKYMFEYKKKLSYLGTKFEILSSDEPDEGEIKIFRHLKNNDNKLKSQPTHLIVGNDADLIVLSMAVKPIINIDILININNERKIISINNLLIDYFNKVMNSNHNDINGIKNSNTRTDFVIISMMMGNDYIDKNIKFVNYDNLWNSYFRVKQRYRGFIVENNKFNYKFLKQFMINIINNMSSQYKKTNPLNFNEKLVENYLEGLLWCLKMYETGNCPKYDYIYNYNTVPTPNDILYFLEFYDTDIITPESNCKPLKSDIYTLLVIPKVDKKIIPNKYHKYIDNEFKYLHNDNYNLSVDDIKKISNIVLND